jgi:2-C-methyl-D-erythritol 4-phosphate cytidylyltransferase
MRVTAVLLAAGRGRRMGRGESKAFLPLAGVPLLALTVRAFARCASVDEIVIVAASSERDRVSALLPPVSQPLRIVDGGVERRDSARAGVAASSGDIVLLHDGARPFPSAELIARVTDAAAEHGACVPVLPAVDTLRYVEEDGSLARETLDRSTVARMQTPQAFRRELIGRALDACPPDVPDDAAAVLALGERVVTVPGEPTNLKVTKPEDLALAEAIAAGLRLEP